MSISRIQTIEPDNNIPKVDIDSTKNNIPKVPVDLQGGGSPIDLQSITITENGTTEAPEGVAYNEVIVNVPQTTLTSISITENGTTSAPVGKAYNEIVVNVPPSLPPEYIESHFDLLNCNSTLGFTDLIKNVKLSSNRYDSFNNGYITQRGGGVWLSQADLGDIKRWVIKTGNFDRTVEPQETWLRLFNLTYNSSYFLIQYDTQDNVWLIRDWGGGNIYISGNDLPKYSFENATIEIIYGAKYIDGVLYRGKKSGNVITEDYSGQLKVYINGNLVIETNNEFGGGNVDYMPVLRIGGYNSWTGAFFEDVKIYNVLNCYDKYYEESVGE